MFTPKKTGTCTAFLGPPFSSIYSWNSAQSAIWPPRRPLLALWSFGSFHRRRARAPVFLGNIKEPCSYVLKLDRLVLKIDTVPTDTDRPPQLAHTSPLDSTLNSTLNSTQRGSFSKYNLISRNRFSGGSKGSGALHGT